MARILYSIWGTTQLIVILVSLSACSVQFGRPETNKINKPAMYLKDSHTHQDNIHNDGGGTIVGNPKRYKVDQNGKTVEIVITADNSEFVQDRKEKKPTEALDAPNQKP
jgi:hypothetical protein